MIRSRLLAFAGLVMLLTAGTARAEEGILVVHVTYLDKKPLARVRIGTTGDGSIEPTDVGGRARIRLPAGMKVDQEVELQVVPGEGEKEIWVFISPWDQRVRVPPFDGQAVPVVLAKKSDKDALLGSSEGRKAIEQKILSELSKLQQAKSEITEEQRRTVLQSQAAADGMRARSLDEREAASEVLEKKADKDGLLGSSEGRKAIVVSILTELSKLRQAKSEITEEQRRSVLQAQAAVYGLKPEEVDAAIRAASRESPDLYEQGLAALYEKNYPVASERLKEALAESERKLTEAQEKLGDRAFLLGQSLYEQGRYPESVIAFKRAAELRGEHAETLNRLGMALEGAGNYPEAESVLNRALTADQRSNSNLGTFIQGNLALVLYDRGDLTGARRLGEQVLESRRHQLGADHPDTLTAMNNLASTLRAQGDLAKARQLQEQVLESRLRRLGADHPDTLTAMNNLASTLRAQGDLTKALQLQEQVLESRRRQLGADHPDTLKVMSNLAGTLGAQGDLVAERALQEQVLRARLRLFGPKHPETSLIEWNLLLTLRDLGDQSGARELEKSLAWLLTAPEAELSAQQREIRQGLKEVQGDEKNHSFTPPAPSSPDSPAPASTPPPKPAPLAASSPAATRLSGFEACSNLWIALRPRFSFAAQ